MGRGNRAKRGEPGRPAYVGFQRGHPPYYTGGSVKGHAQTNKGDISRIPPEYRSAANPHSLGQPAGSLNHSSRVKTNGLMRHKARERQCLEALQNGKEADDLERHFPPGLVRRLKALAEVAEDPTHRDFLNANRLLRDILGTDRGVDPDEPTAAGAALEIRVLRGSTDPRDLPSLPGAPAPPGEAAGPGSEEGQPPSEKPVAGESRPATGAH